MIQWTFELNLNWRVKWGVGGDQTNNIRSFTDFPVLVCCAKNETYVRSLLWKTRTMDSWAVVLATADLINAAASTALPFHDVQSVCSRECMRNSLQYNLRNVFSIRLVYFVVRMQFAIAQQMSSREAHENVGPIISKVGHPTTYIGHAAASINRGY